MVDPAHANLQSKVFFVWGSFCFVCIAFIYFMVYETKGLSLEQVDELYGTVSQAWKSKQFRPALSFAEMEQMGEGGRHMSIVEMVAVQERKRSIVQMDNLDYGGNGVIEKI